MDARHCVPATTRADFVKKYKNTYAWHLSEPRRYKSPVPFEREQGQVIFVQLAPQPSVMQALSVVAVAARDTSNLAAVAAEHRQAQEDNRSGGALRRLKDAAAEAAKQAAKGTGDCFGASRADSLRSALRKCRLGPVQHCLASVHATPC